MQTVRLDLLGLEDGERLLDLGCGAGRHMHAAYYGARCHVVGVDLGLDDLKRTRDGFGSLPDMDTNSGRFFSLAQGSALNLPFADRSFDRIICSEVLEHIPDYRQALHEIMRVLKPGGTFAVSVPRFWPERLCWAISDDYHNAPGGHIRIFREEELRRAVEGNGLRYRRRHFAHGLHAPYWWLKCAVGVNREDNHLVNLYKRFLEWDILSRPLLTRALEAIAAPLMGKSVVLYFAKGEA
jgi:SAM-dependent methyltransferase